jgi:hypothetical protein
LKRFIEIFKEVDYNCFDSFGNDTHNYLHSVYDIGNKYVHAKNPSTPKEDATRCLNMLAHILSDIYGVESLSEGKIVKSGYCDFPDICKGMNFAMEVSPTPEAAMRAYLNLPSKRQFNLMMDVIGTWSGEWKTEKGIHQTGILTFFSNREDYIDAILKYTNLQGEYINEPMEIRLFGDYFHLIGFDQSDMKHKKDKHIYFELEFFNDKLLIGQNIEHKGKVIFNKRDV